MGYIVELKASGDVYDLIPDGGYAEVTAGGHLLITRRSGNHAGGFETIAIFDPSVWRAVYKDKAVQEIRGTSVENPFSIDQLKGTDE